MPGLPTGPTCVQRTMEKCLTDRPADAVREESLEHLLRTY